MRLTRPAERDVDRAIARYRRTAPAQAPRFYDEVRRAMARLGNHPLSSQETSRKLVRRAVLANFPYVVFCAIEADEIVI